MADRQNLRGVYQFAITTSCCAVLLLMAGALVTSNNAADSVPDWPLAYGRIIPPLVGGVRFEYAHRVLAGVVSVLTLILAIWVTRVDRRPLARRLGWTALALVIAQAVLGGIRVLVGHPALSATGHATLAQIYFLTMVGLSLYLSPWWQGDHPPLEDASSPSARSLALWTTLAILVQLVLGAAFRHGAFGIQPHMMGAGILIVLVILTGRTVKKRFKQVRELRRGVVFLHAFFGTQLLLGGAAYWAVMQAGDNFQPSPTYVLLTVAHVLGGALTLAASANLTLKCFRLIRKDSFVADSTPDSSGAHLSGRTTAG
ncbi:MAG: COX15/CtaA family protein [Candidatus Acidiferrales bacterium]|jgi:cytochrome c oxidase assembly protein subunit 15